MFVLVTSSAFAYDGSVYGDSIGKFLRKEFIETASDIGYAKELIETATDGADLEPYIMDNYKVLNKDKFALW